MAVKPAAISTSNFPRPQTQRVKINGGPMLDVVDPVSLERSLLKQFNDLLSLAKAIQQPNTRAFHRTYGSYAMADTDETILADASLMNSVITLPDATRADGHTVVIQKVDAGGNTVTVVSRGGQTIHGTQPFSLTSPYQTLRAEAHNNQWWVVTAGVGGGAGPGAPPGGGTVTSVGLTAPPEFVVSGSPVTTSGTLALTRAIESINTVWAGPPSGVSGLPGFRSLVSADIPASLALTGTPTAPTASAGTNSLQIATTAFVAAAIGSIGGTPTTAPANTVYAGPTSGAAGAPTMRLLVAADIPGVLNRTEFNYSSGGNFTALQATAPNGSDAIRISAVAGIADYHSLNGQDVWSLSEDGSHNLEIYSYLTAGSFKVTTSGGGIFTGNLQAQQGFLGSLSVTTVPSLQLDSVGGGHAQIIFRNPGGNSYYWELDQGTYGPLSAYGLGWWSYQANAYVLSLEPGSVNSFKPLGIGTTPAAGYDLDVTASATNGGTAHIAKSALIGSTSQTGTILEIDSPGGSGNASLMFRNASYIWDVYHTSATGLGFWTNSPGAAGGGSVFGLDSGGINTPGSALIGSTTLTGTALQVTSAGGQSNYPISINTPSNWWAFYAGPIPAYGGAPATSATGLAFWNNNAGATVLSLDGSGTNPAATISNPTGNAGPALAVNGIATATTPTAGDFSTKVATTAFVHNALSGISATPTTHAESLTDGAGNFIFAKGDIVTVIGLPN